MTFILILLYLFAGFFWCGMTITVDQLKHIDDSGFPTPIYLSLCAFIWPFLLMLRSGRSFSKWLNSEAEKDKMPLEDHFINDDK